MKGASPDAISKQGGRPSGKLPGAFYQAGSRILGGGSAARGRDLAAGSRSKAEFQTARLLTAERGGFAIIEQGGNRNQRRGVIDQVEP